jgi:hypothetical protein
MGLLIAVLALVPLVASAAVSWNTYISTWGTAIFSQANGWTATSVQDLFRRNGMELTVAQAQQIVDYESAGQLDESREYAWSVLGSQVQTPSGNAAVGPASSIGGTVNLVMRTRILPRAEPSTSKEMKRSGSMRADAFYNSWKIETAGTKFEGSTYGLNPSIMFGGDAVDFGLTVPLHVIHPDNGDDIYNAGVDALLRFRLGDYLAIGAHGLYLHEFGEDSDYETRYYLSGGPFVSLMLPLNDVFSLSLACMYEYTKPEDDKYGDDVQLLIPAANLGINISESVALNAYGMYFKNLDSDVEDDYYIDVGGDLVVSLGSVWALSLGGKTTLEWDDYDSWEVFLGSEWHF